MQNKKLEELLESLNLSEEKAHAIRTVLREMLAHTKKEPEGLSKKEEKLLLMAKMVEEKDWRRRASLAAALISIDL